MSPLQGGYNKFGAADVRNERVMYLIEEGHIALLESISDKGKFLHMGRSPVKAIVLAWEWEKEGLVIFVDDYVNITEKGRDTLEENKEHYANL